MKKLFYKKGAFYLSILFGLLFLGSIVTLLYLFYNNQNSKTRNYTSTGDINYTVDIIDNKYIENTTLESGRSYITSLVKDMNINLSYDLSSKEVLDFTYTYEIKSNLYILYNLDPASESNPKLWDKNYNIYSTDGVLSLNSNELTISKNIVIDIKSYIDEMFVFMNKFNLSVLPYVRIEMPITVYGSNENYSLSAKYSVDLTIKVLDDVFVIDSITAHEVKDNLVYIGLVEDKTTIYIPILIVLSLLSLLLSSISIKKLLFNPNRDNYQKYLDKTKKEYAEFIVKTSSMIDLKKFKVVLIDDFDELVNLSSTLTLPIMLFEQKSNSKFYILKEDIIYIYNIRKKDLK